MWMPAREEAEEMYAVYLRARHGRSACQYARKTADKFYKKGDLEGHAVWSRVADAVERGGEKGARAEAGPPLL